MFSSHPDWDWKSSHQYFRRISELYENYMTLTTFGLNSTTWVHTTVHVQVPQQIHRSRPNGVWEQLYSCRSIPKGRIAAATYRIKLDMSTACRRIFPILYSAWARPREVPSIAHSLKGSRAPGLIGLLGSLGPGPPSLYPKQHLGWSCRFRTGHGCGQQTDT